MPQVARKASTTYYPTLHLEIARYVAAATQAKVELPWTLARLVAPPPAAMCKSGRAPKAAGASTPKRGSYAGGPQLPTPKKVEPLRL